MKITSQMIEAACEAMYIKHPSGDVACDDARRHNMRNALVAGITAAPAQMIEDVGDQTFHRVCVAQEDAPYGPVIYVHPENGNLTRDVIDAQGFLFKKVGADLKKTMEFARQTHPGANWQYARVLWKVIPFRSQDIVESLIVCNIRRTAEIKLKGAGLTADEMASLGL